MSIKKWKTLSKKTVYDKKHLRIREDIVELPSKARIEYNFIELSTIVGVIPMTKNNKILMIRQYRYPVDRISLEIPAGYVEKGEVIRRAAVRETEEEIGYRPRKLRKITAFQPLPGRTNLEVHIFLASDLKKTQTNFDEGEFIEILEVDKKKALDYIVNGKITHATSVIGILCAHEKGLI